MTSIALLPLQSTLCFVGAATEVDFSEQNFAAEVTWGRNPSEQVALPFASGSGRNTHLLPPAGSQPGAPFLCSQVPSTLPTS